MLELKMIMKSCNPPLSAQFTQETTWTVTQSNIFGLVPQFPSYLHSKAFPTTRTAEGLLPLMVSQSVVLQSEEAAELLVTTFSGAQVGPFLLRALARLS